MFTDRNVKKNSLTTKSANNKSLIQGKGLPNQVILVYSMLVAAYFFSYFFRVSSSVVLPDLATKWGMSASLVGLISSLYFYTYALMQPLSGALNDRFGSVIVVSMGMAVTGIGALMFGLAPNPFILAVGRLLTGLGLAPMLSGVLVFQSGRFPKEKYAFLSGITYTVGNFGAVISVAPLALAIATWNRGPVFIVLAVVNFMLAASLLMKRKADPIYDRKVSVKPVNVFTQLRIAFKKIGKTKQLKMMIILWAVSFGSLMSLQGLWSVSWFKTAYDISSKTASFWATLIGVGVMLGNFLGANIASEVTKRKKAISLACSFYGLLWIALWIIIKIHLPISVVGLTAFLLGISAGISYVHLTAGVNDLAANGNGGSLFGAMNLFTFTGVIIFQWGTGFILQFFPAAQKGVYTSEGYLITFGIVVILVLTSLIAVKFLKPFDELKEKEALDR